MKIEKSELEFKKEKRQSACTAPPWAIFIPPMQRPEVLRIIRQEMIDAVGIAYDECPKRLTCFKKTCLGRPLPWRSKTAQPYLQKLAETQDLVLNTETGELELFIQTNCQTCPLFKTCKSPCNQVIDFVERDKAPEPIINYKNTDNYDVAVVPYEPANFIVNKNSIPWDVLAPKKAEVIRKYLYEQRDFRYIAEALNLNNQARVKYEFYSAINKLSEFAAVRQFLKDHRHELTKRQQQIFDLVYEKNNTFVKVAEELQISKQSVQQLVARILKRYKVKWHSYVKKRGNKVLYNVPEVFK